jgi:hypothetical protein
MSGNWIIAGLGTPPHHLCVFLGHVLSADHSCRAAVARIPVRIGDRRHGDFAILVADSTRIRKELG